MTLTEFLLARIAEREASAHYALSRGDGGALEYGGQWYGAIKHAERWEPARVLAECEAQRAIVERCARVDFLMPSSHLAGGILSLLAQPDADHPDFQEEWQA